MIKQNTNNPESKRVPFIRKCAICIACLSFFPLIYFAGRVIVVANGKYNRGEGFNVFPRLPIWFQVFICSSWG